MVDGVDRLEHRHVHHGLHPHVCGRLQAFVGGDGVGAFSPLDDDVGMRNAVQDQAPAVRQKAFMVFMRPSSRMGRMKSQTGPRVTKDTRKIAEIAVNISPHPAAAGVFSSYVSGLF